jgi:hypothetical protein
VLGGDWLQGEHDVAGDLAEVDRRALEHVLAGVSARQRQQVREKPPHVPAVIADVRENAPIFGRRTRSFERELGLAHQQGQRRAKVADS